MDLQVEVIVHCRSEEQVRVFQRVDGDLAVEIVHKDDEVVWDYFTSFLGQGRPWRNVFVNEF